VEMSVGGGRRRFIQTSAKSILGLVAASFTTNLQEDFVGKGKKKTKGLEETREDVVQTSRSPVSKPVRGFGQTSLKDRKTPPRYLRTWGIGRNQIATQKTKIKTRFAGGVAEKWIFAARQDYQLSEKRDWETRI